MVDLTNKVLHDFIMYEVVEHPHAHIIMMMMVVPLSGLLCGQNYFPRAEENHFTLQKKLVHNSAWIYLQCLTFYQIGIMN